MTRIPFILSTIALAVLAGCSSQPQRTAQAPAPAPVKTTPVTAAPAPAAAPTPAYVVAPAGTVIVQANPAGTVGAAPAPVALRAGFGRIESIHAVPSAAAGATASNSTKRIAMRMDDGTVQYFDTQAAGVAVGDRIEIRSDGTMRHPA